MIWIYIYIYEYVCMYIYIWIYIYIWHTWDYDRWCLLYWLLIVGPWDDFQWCVVYLFYREVLKMNNAWPFHHQKKSGVIHLYSIPHYFNRVDHRGIELSCARHTGDAWICFKSVDIVPIPQSRGQSVGGCHHLWGNYKSPKEWKQSHNNRWNKFHSESCNLSEQHIWSYLLISFFVYRWTIFCGQQSKVAEKGTYSTGKCLSHHLRSTRFTIKCSPRSTQNAVYW